MGNGPVLNCQLGGTGGAYWCGALPDLDELDPADISIGNHMDDTNYRELVLNAQGYPRDFPSTREDWGVWIDMHNAHVRADLDFADGWSLGSIVSYSYSKQSYYSDRQHRDMAHIPNPFYPATPAALADACRRNLSTCYAPPTIRYSNASGSTSKDFTVESRLTSPQDRRIRGTVGTSLFTRLLPGGHNYGVTVQGRYANAKTKSTVYTPAVFAGIYADVTQDLKVSLEGRYQWDRIGQQQLFPTASPILKDTFKSFAPRVSVDYQVTDSQMAYATFSRGFSPGGFNTALVGLTA